MADVVKVCHATIIQQYPSSTLQNVITQAIYIYHRRQRQYRWCEDRHFFRSLRVCTVRDWIRRLSSRLDPTRCFQHLVRSVPPLVPTGPFHSLTVCTQPGRRSGPSHGHTPSPSRPHRCCHRNSSPLCQNRSLARRPASLDN